MDGSVADFDRKIREGLARIGSSGEVLTLEMLLNEPDWLDARKMLIKSQPGFWRNLPRIEEGFAVVNLLREIGFTLNVLTKGPFRTTSAWTEKVEWCREHLDNVPVTITEDKGLVYGRVLFDDWPSYMTRWLSRRPRGVGVMLETEWNQNFSHPSVFKVRKTHLAEDLVTLRPILQAAFDR